MRRILLPAVALTLLAGCEPTLRETSPGSNGTEAPIEALASSTVTTPPSPCPNCVLAPTTFIRKDGQTAPAVREFPGDPQADYLIVVQDDRHERTGAEIFLNGESIIARTELTGFSVVEIRKPLRLKATNRLTVLPLGVAGARVTVWILGGAELVGAGGGSIVVPGSGITLQVPAGAVAQPTELQVVVDPAAPDTVRTPVGLLGRTISLLPDGLLLTAPALLLVPRPASLASTNVDAAGLLYDDPTDGLYLWLPGGYAPATGGAWAPLTHFSNYTVNWIPPTFAPRTQAYTWALASTFSAPSRARSHTGAPVSQGELIREIARAVAGWSFHLGGANVRFAQAAAGATPDIEIRFSPNVGAVLGGGLGGLYYGVVGYNKTTGGRLILLNDEGAATATRYGRAVLTWYIVDDILETSLDRAWDGASDYTRDVVLFNVLQHEFGHILGLRHQNSAVCDAPGNFTTSPVPSTLDECLESPVMAPIISGFYPVALADQDLALLQQAYGSGVIMRAARRIVAHSTTSPAGSAGQLVSPDPEVTVVDQNGSPVGGVAVLFDPNGSTSGTVLGKVQMSDPSTGRARVGSWRAGSGGGPWSLDASFYDRVTGRTLPFIGSGSRETEVFTAGQPLVAPTPLHPSLADTPIRQNDPTIGCTFSPTHGYGFRVDYDWSDVPGATGYHLYAKHATAVNPVLNVTLPATSSFGHLSCNSYVAPVNEQGWQWRVAAIDANGVEGPWSPDMPFGFGPMQFPPQPTGSSLHFDGVDDFVGTPYAPALDVSALTIEAWVKLERDIGATQVRIAARQSSVGGGESWGLELMGPGYGPGATGNMLVFHAGNCVNHVNVYTNVNLIAGTWYHVAATNDGQTLNVYLNGSRVTQQAAIGPVCQPAGVPITIGMTAPGAQLFWPGWIDEVRVWRVARTQLEIQSTMRSKAVATEPDLVAYWAFDEAQGAVAGDQSPNDLDGTVNGATWSIEGW